MCCIQVNELQVETGDLIKAVKENGLPPKEIPALWKTVSTNIGIFYTKLSSGSPTVLRS